jgi:isocitrate dehydrogenase
VRENHLRWDSLGEFLALGVSLEHLSAVFDNAKARVLAKALDAANTRFLIENKSPSRKVRELDNRGSHFYLALYWAEALAVQEEDRELKSRFAPLAGQLSEKEAAIVEELNQVQGAPVEIGGYFRPDVALATAAMRPSATLNESLSQL